MLSVAPPDLFDVADAYSSELSEVQKHMLKVTEAALWKGTPLSEVRPRGEGYALSAAIIEAGLVELKAIFCGKAKKYAHLRESLSTSAEHVVAAIAGYIANALSIAAGVAAGITGALMVIIYRIGVKAFCLYMSKRQRSI